MQLSIVIVNYNVKYFLEQCLCSLQKAIELVEAEIWVVDNASTDNSIDYLQPRFPGVHFIRNVNNAGFAKANNQVLSLCSGKYVLFLNPDTLLPEDCLIKSLSFLETNTQAGALGIRMIDGSGTFLPESKRSFPGPLTSLYKLSGLSRMFPKSRIFSRYALTYLNEFKSHEVDVLAGAFMIVKKDLLLRLKGFDEAFFMYGEDIDLSYRIQQAGYKNYYFSGSSIIHFKGESTRKGSLNYVKMFYRAMSIFVSKHYSGSTARIFAFFIQIAIWVRAGISAMGRSLLKTGMPLTDAIIIFISFELVNYLWITFIRNGIGFRSDLINIALPGFTVVFFTAATLAGIYDNKYKPLKAFYAAMVGIVVMLAVYSLLPEAYRFSRGVILLGGFSALLSITSVRWLLLKYSLADDEDETKKLEQTLIAGSVEEFNDVKSLLQSAGLAERIIGRIAPDGIKEDALGNLQDLPLLLNSLQVKEIIFCGGKLSFKEIIEAVQKSDGKVSARFHAKGTSSIVGSDSKNTSGETVSTHGNFQLAQPYQRRMKRIVDCSVATVLLITFPIHMILIGFSSITNAFSVLTGRKTWVGYIHANNDLPAIRTGVLLITGNDEGQLLSGQSISQIDYWYAKNYDWTQDVKIILKSYRRLSAV